MANDWHGVHVLSVNPVQQETQQRELRHTFVSVSSVSGVSVEEIACLAGHASSRTTETIYRHELRPVLTTGADVMDQILV